MEYLFTLFIPLAAAVVVVITAKRIASHPFRCKHCGKDFTVKWQKILVTKHSEGEYMLLCPHCASKDWCTEQAK